MKRFTKECRQEMAIYLIGWTVFFLMPVCIQGYRALTNPQVSFQFSMVWSIWLAELPFLVLFILHNNLAFIFFKKKDFGIYAIVTVLLLLLFWAYQAARSPGPLPGATGAQGPFPNPEGPMPPRNGRPPLSPETMKILMAVFLVAANLGVKSYFQAQADRKRMEELERENLRHQLAYFRYQISPHFFMNTLNNIHALVDIDPEKAKSSIVELSKMMRYILYEGSKPTIPLDMETDFLKQYISLMRLRYSDSVRIEVSLPENTSGAEVPPLVFVSFVENAFKHGVSYESESYIVVRMALEDDKVFFRCENSRHPNGQQERSGIGLENARHRFSLLYDDRYTMHVEESADKYIIYVVIPAQAGTIENKEK